MYGT